MSGIIDEGLYGFDSAEPPPKSVNCFPAYGALLAAIATLTFAFLAFRAIVGQQRIIYGLVAYVCGALAASILWNVQRAFGEKAKNQHTRIQNAFGVMSAEFLARVSMFVGLGGAIWAAVTVATELARQ